MPIKRFHVKFKIMKKVVYKIESESESIVEKEMWNREWKNQLPSQADALGIATLPMTRAQHYPCLSPHPQICHLVPSPDFFSQFGGFKGPVDPVD